MPAPRRRAAALAALLLAACATGADPTAPVPDALAAGTPAAPVGAPAGATPTDDAVGAAGTPAAPVGAPARAPADPTADATARREAAAHAPDDATARREAAAAASEAPADPVPTAPPPAGPPVVDRLLPYGPDREALTVAYLAAHRTTPLTGDAAVDTRMDPRVIVLHWTAGPTAESAWSTFAPARLAGRPDLADAGALNVGAHYLVDRDGTIVRMAPEDRVLRHCIGLNHVAIGIENVGGGERWPLTDAQVAANAALVRAIAARRPITHLVGHSEYRGFEGHPYFEERDPTYRTTKPDPGADFLARVRAEIADLGLAGAP